MGNVLQLSTPEWALPLLEASRYKGAWGGRGCVHPDTLIDTPSGAVKVRNFKGGDVYSFLKGKTVIAKATAAFPCTEEDLFEVILENDSSIVVTDQHRFLTTTGWKLLSSLSVGDDVVLQPRKFSSFLPQTNLDTSPLMSEKDVQRLIETLEDYRVHCSEYCSQYDPQLQTSKGIYLTSSQQQDDAKQHSFHVLFRLGGLQSFGKCILSLASGLFSSRAFPVTLGQLCYAGLGNYNGGKSSVSPLEKPQEVLQFHGYRFLKPQDYKQKVRFQVFGYLKRQAQSLQTLFCILRNAVSYKVASDQSYLHPNDCEDFHYNRVRLIRKHSRRIYWDLHVFKTNNYYSQGFINHNSGKSHMFAEMMIESHIMNQKRRSVCVREIQKSLNQSVKRLLETKIQSMNAGAYFEVQDAVIKSKKADGAIIFQGMQNHTADSIKSLEGYDCAWVEEAQSLSQTSLDLLRPTIRKPDSELWFTWNPRQQSDPVDFLLRGPTPPKDATVIKVNFSDNPWFPQVLRDEMEYDKRRDPDKYHHVWQGSYLTNSNAMVFKNWTIDEFDAPPDAIHRLGADWGFAVDPTTLVRCHIIGRTLYIDYEAYMIGCEIVNTPELFMQVPESEKWPIVADSARPETISHMRKNGFPKIMTAVKGPKSVEEGVEFLKNYDIVVHPRCIHTIDELMLYSYKQDPLTGRILPILDDKKNHVIDALRYACEGIRRAAVKKPAIFTPLPTIKRW